MRTQNDRFRFFSPSPRGSFIFCLVAFISSIILAPSTGKTQASPPRAETDSRPSEPAKPPAAKPSPSASPIKVDPKATPKPPVKPGATKPPVAPTSMETSRKFPKVVTKLVIDDLQNGRGRLTKAGSRLVVHYHSWLYDPTQPLGRGPQFESTQGKAPYKFVLQNPDQTHIKGWEEGLVDMKVGGKRRLIIPPDMGYGANGAGQVIPPGATLLYEIELIDVE